MKLTPTNVMMSDKTSSVNLTDNELDVLMSSLQYLGLREEEKLKEQYAVSVATLFNKLATSKELYE
jgi:hypothetical protein